MWFKNLRLYRLSPSWNLALHDLEEALQKEAFRPISGLVTQSLGWIAPRNDGPLAYALEGQILLSMRAENRLLPNSVINQVVAVKAEELEARQGFAPGRKQLRELKESVTDELLPKAFSVYRDTSVWIDRNNRWLVIDTPSLARADEVIGLLSDTLNPLPVLPLHLEQSPSSTMTQWLLNNEAARPFSIGQDIELRASDESRAVVRYLRESVDPDEAKKHIEAGKQCTRMALTWADRISFVLGEDLSLKRVTPLDILTEEKHNSNHSDEEALDADFTLMTAELAELLGDLVEALGGEQPLPGTWAFASQSA